MNTLDYIKQKVNKFSVMLKLNIMLFVIFIVLVLFSYKNYLESKSQRQEVFKKVKEIELIIFRHSLDILERINFKNKNTLLLDFFDKNVEKIKTDFSAIGLKSTPSTFVYKNKFFLKYQIKLNLKAYEGPDQLVIFGYFKENANSLKLFKRWPLFSTCNGRMLKSSNCSENFNLVWYCVSNRKKFLPNELRHFYHNNTPASLVPLSCRF